MLLKWFSHVLSGVLVVSLCGLIVATVLSQTLMSSSYIESQFSKANAYDWLSSALVENIVRDLVRRFGVIAGTFLVTGAAARTTAAKLQSGIRRPSSRLRNGRPKAAIG